MTTATLNTEFHGTPAGTKLIVVDQYVDCQDNEILIVERADGLDLPALGGPYFRTNIAARFVTVAA